MSEVKVNKISPRSGTTVTLGDSGDTFTLASGVSLTGVNATFSGDLTVDTNTLFVDSSTNRVGIGTSSPSTSLTLDIGTNNVGLYQNSSDATSGISLADNGGSINLATTSSGAFRVLVGGDANTSADNSSEAMRIDSSGNVGIGTSSPKRSLQIGDNTDSLEILSIQSTTSGSSRIYFGSNDGTNAEYSGFLWYDHSNDSLRIATDSTERMRIDSSGNVLVNTTDTSLYNNTGASDGGFAINDSRGSYVQIARDDGATLLLNLLGTNDGALIGFYRSGTQVGSIRAEDGDIIFGNDTRGLKYRDADVIPRNMNDSTADNIVDLGSSTSRFKNLLLGGSVYLGGTGSANALDDYEEGTWTPIFKGDGGDPTCTYDIQSGKYIKIGQQVTAWFTLGTDASSGGSGTLRVGGIPFTPDPSGDYGGILTSEYGFATTGTIKRLGNGNANGVRVDDDEGTAVTTSILGTGTNDNRLFGTIVYFTA